MITIATSMLAELIEFKAKNLIECLIEEGVYPEGSEKNKVLILDEAKLMADQLIQEYGGDNLHEIVTVLEHYIIGGPIPVEA